MSMPRLFVDGAAPSNPCPAKLRGLPDVVEFRISLWRRKVSSAEIGGRRGRLAFSRLEEGRFLGYLVVVFRRRFWRPAGRRHSWHGLWCALEHGFAGDRPAALHPQARSSTLPRFFTTSASAASRIHHLKCRLAPLRRAWESQACSAPFWAPVLSNIEVGSARRFVYIYLLIMGIYILWKSLRIGLAPRPPAGWTSVLGFGAGFLDATGGGGWDR